MATVDEILSGMPEEEITTEVMDDVFAIDPNTRLIHVPESEAVFGVTSDEAAERKRFRCARIVGNNLDLSSSVVRVNFRNANGDADSYIVTDVTVIDENVEFTWELSRKVTSHQGDVHFIVCAVNGDKEWNTTLATGKVLEGLEPEVDGDAVEETTSDVIAQLVSMVVTQTETVRMEGAVQVNAVQDAAMAATVAATAEITAKGTNTLASIPDDYTALSEAVNGLVRTAAPGIVCEAEGSAVAVSDASDNYVRGLRIFGRSTQDGTPTPDAPVEIVSVESPTITIDEQSLALPYSLPGTPVTSGGNYTDENGQQWVCDEVDLERGVYVQRIRNLMFTGEEVFDNTWYPVAIYHIHSPAPHVNLTHNSVRCSHFHNISCGNTLGTSLAIGNLDKLGFASSGDLTEYFVEQHRQNTPVVVQYAVATPIETPLSETEIAAYRALHTNKPNTTVLNDAGAHMAVAYVADTKLYIDNKIAALTAQA